MTNSPNVPPEYRLLPVDAATLDHKIFDFEAQRIELADAIMEAVDQSAETWHDNAPLDVVNQMKEFVDGELSKLYGIQRGMSIITPPTNPTQVEPGTIVTLSGDTGIMHVEIAGDWQGRYVPGRG